MKNLNHNFRQGYQKDEERLEFAVIVRSNTIQCIQILIEAVGYFDEEYEKEENKTRAKNLAKLDPAIHAEITYNPVVSEDIAALWEDSAIRSVYARSAEYQIPDSAAYFLDNCHRFADTDYVPTLEDILRVRLQSTGIVEIGFEYANSKFRLIDVGGQRSERRKWIHSFNNVTAVLFVVALSEFDQMLYEDVRVNRMHESLQLFAEIANSDWFRYVSIMLFFNKTDLFKEKIATKELKQCFPEYDGGHDYDKALQYITDMFVGQNKITDHRIYPHYTCATDTGSIRFVFEAVKDILIRNAVRVIGL